MCLPIENFSTGALKHGIIAVRLLSLISKAWGHKKWFNLKPLLTQSAYYCLGGPDEYKMISGEMYSSVLNKRPVTFFTKSARNSFEEPIVFLPFAHIIIWPRNFTCLDPLFGRRIINLSYA